MTDLSPPTELPLSLMIPEAEMAPSCCPSLSPAVLRTPMSHSKPLPRTTLKPRKKSSSMDVCSFPSLTTGFPSAVDASADTAVRSGAGFSTPLFSSARPPQPVESLVRNAPQFPDSFSPEGLANSHKAPFLPLPKQRIKRARGGGAAGGQYLGDELPPAKGPKASSPSLFSMPLTSQVFLPDIPTTASSPESCMNFPHPRRRQLRMRPTRAGP